MKKEHAWAKWIYWFLFAVAVIFVYKTLDNFSDITIWLKNFFSLLAPFVMAIIISYLFYLPFRNTEILFKNANSKFIKKHARLLSVFVVYLVALCIIAILINVILPIVSESLIELASNIPAYYENTISFIENLPDDSWLNRLNLKDAIYSIQNINVSNIFSVENLLRLCKKRNWFSSYFICSFCYYNCFNLPFIRKNRNYEISS